MEDYIANFAKSENISVSRVLEFFPVDGEDVIHLHKVCIDLANQKQLPSGRVTFNELAQYFQPKLAIAASNLESMLDRYENDLLNTSHQKNICAVVISAILLQQFAARLSYLEKRLAERLSYVLRDMEQAPNTNQIKMNRLLDYFNKMERSFDPIRNLHKLNDKVDYLTKIITKPNFGDIRSATAQGPLNVPFINPNTQSIFMNQNALAAQKPSTVTLPPYVAPHMRSEVLTNHVWVWIIVAEIKDVDGDCLEDVERAANHNATTKQAFASHLAELKEMIIENDPRMLSFLNDYELDGDHKKLYTNFLSLAKSGNN